MLFPVVSLGSIWQSACSWKCLCFIPVLSPWLVIKMWTVQDMHIISALRFWRKLLGFLREPGHAEGGLMHLGNLKQPDLLPNRVCCILVLLSCSWWFQKWQSYPCTEFWWLLALLKALLRLHVGFVLPLRKCRSWDNLLILVFQWILQNWTLGAELMPVTGKKIAFEIRKKAKKWFL